MLKMIYLQFRLRQISIPGRLAYSIECLENVISILIDKSIIIKSDEIFIRLIIDRLWEFTESQDLSVWEKRGVEISPFVIFDVHEENYFEDYETLSVQELHDLKSFYEKCPNYLNDVIDNCVEIGLSNLYGGITGVAQTSIDKVKNIIELLAENKIKIPNVDRYSKFKFKNGWADNFTKADI